MVTNCPQEHFEGAELCVSKGDPHNSSVHRTAHDCSDYGHKRNCQNVNLSLRVSALMTRDWNNVSGVTEAEEQVVQQVKGRWLMVGSCSYTYRFSPPECDCIVNE